jgi:hypothetical protein
MGACVQGYRLDEMKALRDQHNTEVAQGLPETLSDAEINLIYTGEKRKLHMSAGVGLKLAMNRNFILSAEVAVPLNTKIYTSTDASKGFNGEIKMKNSYKPGVNIGLNYIF